MVENVDNPWTLSPARKLNYRFGVLEGILNLYGEYPADVVLSVNKQMGHFMNENNSWDGNYPARINGWIPFIVELLKKDPDSRRAVVPIYGKPDLNADSKDICCTLTLQFLVRDGKLNMIVNMRSNDALLGTANDVVQFMIFQKTIASLLGIPTGWYSHHAGSMHIYERDEERIMAVINDKEELIKDFPMFPSSMSIEGMNLNVKMMVEKLRYVNDTTNTSTADLHNHWFGEPWLGLWKVLTKQ